MVQYVRPWRCALLWLLILIAFAPGAAAQPLDEALTSRFQAAERYLQTGQNEPAIRMLTVLHQEKPDVYLFYDRLRTALESVKRYDDAARLVDGQIRRQGRSVPLLADRGRLEYLSGSESAALKTFEEALAVEPNEPNAYRLVYQALYSLRLLEEAIGVLERAARLPGQEGVFLNDLGFLYLATGRYEEATDAYLGMLARSERQLPFVLSRLQRLMEDPAALAAGVRATERASAREPLNMAYRRLLNHLYLEAGMYDKALNTALAVDRLNDENGQGLIVFARAAADAGAIAAASRAYEEVSRRDPDGPAAPLALFELGELFTRSDLSAEMAIAPDSARALRGRAVTLFADFLKRYPSDPRYPEALRRLADLQREVLGDDEKAARSYREVVRLYPGTAAAEDASLQLAKIAVSQGDLADARTAFVQLAERLRTGPTAEEARLELARLHFYQGEFTAAHSLLRALDQNTSALVANDAIDLKVLLSENRGPDSLSTPLRRYAGAALLLRQGKYDDALSLLDSLIAAEPQHALADDAHLLRAEALQSAGRLVEAEAALSEIPLLFPGSFLADRSLFKAASLLEERLDDPATAITRYTRLLVDYPGSLLAPEARTRIRALRGDGL